MRLSIIIPVYNVEKYLSNCLDSLLKQGLDFSEYEIIAINDGSTDNSLQILNKYTSLFPNIKVHNFSNKGPGAIRNIGIDLALGKYIYFIDSDDYLAENSLGLILSEAFKYDVDVLTFNTTLTRSLNLKGSSKELPKISDSDVLNGYNYLNEFNYRNEVWWYIIKKDHLDKLGIRLIEHRWLEDVIFTVTILLYSDKIIHLPIDAHRYLKRSTSITATNNSDDKLKMIRHIVEVVKDYEPVVKKVNAIKFENTQNLTDNIKAKQQSFVFFMMIRMFKSNMKFDEVKSIMNEMSEIKAYPLDSFSRKNNNGVTYQILVRLFKTKPRFYFLFKLFNPFLKLRYKFLNPI